MDYMEFSERQMDYFAIEEEEEFKHVISCTKCRITTQEYWDSVYVEPCPKLRQILAAWDAVLALKDLLDEVTMCLFDKERIRFRKALWENAGVTIN